MRLIYPINQSRDGFTVCVCVCVCVGGGGGAPLALARGGGLLFFMIKQWEH